MADRATEGAERFLGEQVGLAATTRETYRTAVVAFLRWRGRAGIDEKSYVRYVARMEADRRRPNYVATVATVLRRYADSRGLNVSRWPRPRNREVAIRPLTDEEVGLLRAACEAGRHPARDRFVVDALVWTGLRVSELVALRWPDVVMRRSRRAPHGVLYVRSGKGAKPRELPLHAEARRAFEGWMGAVGPGAGGSDDGGPVIPIATRYGINLMLVRAARRANLSALKVHPHVLRHTFAANWRIRDWGPEAGLQRYLGHASPRTTSRYGQFATYQVLDRFFADGIEKSSK